VEACQAAFRIIMAIERDGERLRSRWSLSDAELIERTTRGDDDAFGEIVRRYQGFVYRQAWGYLRNTDAARDAAQEVFIRAYQGIRCLRAEKALRRWLYRICRNLCLNIIRKQKTEQELLRMEPAPTHPDTSLRVSLMGLISRLDDPYREVITLRYYNDLTYAEIAEVLDISISNVKVRLFRARKMLKTMLGEP
jgi:RNA polymerase sigma-70 factor (ECF subfamily)